MESFTFPQQETELVLQVVQRIVSPCTVYVFGYRQQSTMKTNFLANDMSVEVSRHHYYLLLFSKELVPNGGTILSHAISEVTQQKITATVLLHKVNDLATRQVGQIWFFDQVLRGGQCLCLDTTAPPYLLNAVTIKSTDADAAYWHKCVGVAQFNIQAAADSEQLDVELCRIALLHTAVNQIALGLIRVFLGYTPNTYSLAYLLQLCGYFTDLPSQVFQQDTSLQSKRYKMLCAPPSMLNHWTKLNTDERDYIWILDACQLLLVEAKALVENELIREK
jgi:hypothetical protein